jgi:hypothetical protein
MGLAQETRSEDETLTNPGKRDSLNEFEAEVIRYRVEDRPSRFAVTPPPQPAAMRVPVTPPAPPRLRMSDYRGWRSLWPFAVGSVIGLAIVAAIVPWFDLSSSRASSASPVAAEPRATTAAPAVVAAPEPVASLPAPVTTPAPVVTLPAAPVRTQQASAPREPAPPQAAPPPPARVVPQQAAPGSAEVRRPVAIPPPAPRAAVRNDNQFVGSLAITSSPEGARVFVNGQLMGATPLVLGELPVGSRALRVEADGHATWSSMVRVVANQRTNIIAPLSRLAQP